ncbi:MAG: MerR family transcriptional regulator [Prevotellaceae bacterium]|jgi:DNA-binding transcriptional MerR regulator|nr:MerR family transcriptional regulator [Prevotellaceae bacterium]
MPYKEPVIEKVFYTIGEVAVMFGENTSLIRFWSNKFEGFINPHKNKKGNRLFTKEDIENFKIIYHLVKEKGMTLEGVKKRMRDNIDGESHNLEIVNTLTSIREMLIEVKEML